MQFYIYLIIVFFVSLTVIILFLYRSIRKIISELSYIKIKLSEYDAIQTELKGSVFSKDCFSNKFNYLAIGNSITLHSVCDYWWSEYGMAATSKDNDYFHRVIHAFESIYGGVNACAVNFAEWEVLSHDRSQQLKLIKPYLNTMISLVTIQLGENIGNISTLDADFRELLSCIRNNAPQAEIVVIGDFWNPNGTRAIIKKRVADTEGLGFIDLSDIGDNKEYMCGLECQVYGDDGKKHVVNHEGVAKHPNDKAMEVIAKRIIMKYEETIKN